MKKIVFFIFLGLMGVGTALSRNGEEPQTNKEVLTAILNQQFEAVLDSISRQKMKVVIQNSETNALSSWWAGNLKEQLLKNGISVYDSLPTGSGMSGVLRIKRLKSDIRYSVADRNLVLHATRYKRMITVYLAYELLSGGNQLIFSRDREMKFEDVVKNSDLEKIEDQFYPFTSGTKIESVWVKRLVEPALITMTTIGVVYMFFTLRSGS